MSNKVYYNFQDLLLNGGNNLGVNLYAVLVDNAYTPNFSTDLHYSDISAHVMAGPVAITGDYVSPTSTGAKAGGNNVTFSTFSSTGTAKAVVILQEATPGTMGASGDLLAVYLDTGTGFPITVSGSPITIQWSGGSTSGDFVQSS